MVVRDGGGHTTHVEIIEWESSEEEEDKKEGGHGELQQLQKLGDNRNATASPERYSLRSGLLLGRSGSPNSSCASLFSSRRTRDSTLHQLNASSSSSSWSSSSSLPSGCSQEPLPHPSDPVQTLLSELASSVSLSKTTFSRMQALSSPRASAEGAYNRARMAMAEELQTISDVHVRLSSVIQQHGIGVKQDHASERSTEASTTLQHRLQKQDAPLLKSYEGIITRFHDEIQKKDAVIEALTETLAKSILKGEKLERRIQALEANRSSVP